MELLFVGTGAADYETTFSCPCEICVGVRTRGARNLRHYSSLLVNGSILLDCGPTAAWRLAELNVPPAAIEVLVFTHSHDDHLDAASVQALLQARAPERGPLPVYGNAAAMGALDGVERLERHTMRPGESVQLPGITLTALLAAHMQGVEDALNWVVEDGTRLLYATDTAWPPPTSWDILQGLCLDAAIVEATFGLLGPGSHDDILTQHLNWPEFLRLRDELISRGILRNDAPYLATHISQHLVPIHDTFSKMAVEPVCVAFDGLRVTI